MSQPIGERVARIETRVDNIAQDMRDHRQEAQAANVAIMNVVESLRKDVQGLIIKVSCAVAIVMTVGFILIQGPSIARSIGHIGEAKAASR